ncbi:MAG: NHL repeat-containing protein [Pirellulaceae bacterium]
MKRTLTFVVALLFVSVLVAQDNVFQSVGGSALDNAAFMQWVDGKESPLSESEAKGGPNAVVWTSNTMPHHFGVKFGDGRAIGVRHLRIGFTEPVEIGSVLVRAGGILSALKADAAYPGDLADESKWIVAERLLEGELSRQEVGAEGYALWVLPAGTKTRALRFSHTPNASDREMAGWLGGVWILERRLGNVAPQALAQSVARDDASTMLVDESFSHGWGDWDNGEQGAVLPISPEHPEFITLTWSKAVRLEGLCLLWTGFADVEIEAFSGKDDANIREAPNASWRRVARRNGMETLYPMALGPQWIAFEKATTTRALRLRIIKGPNPAHPHLVDKVKEGRRVWLGEVLAVASLAKDASLTSLVLPRVSEEPPLIPVKFTLPEAGVVTLVIEDMQNHRVRNLVSETPFPAGENIAWWDGSDDLLRDPEAARHGVYHILARPVAPGTYKVRGLWHQPLKLRYEFSIYNAGKPSWETADNTGCWLTTHTPPTSVVVVPGSRTADGEPLVFLGAFVAEGGHGLQWLREDGTKVGGQGWVGGNWTGAPTLAVDRGPQAVAEHLCYVGSAFEGELRLTAKTRALSDQPVLNYKLGDEIDRHKKDIAAPPELEGFDGGENLFVLGGIAAQDGMLVCSLVRQNELLVVDIKNGKLASRIAVPNPRGLAFDTQGRLLALSGRTLVRFASLSSKPETLIASGLEDPRHVAIDATGNLLITDRGTSHQVKKFTAAGKFISAIGKPGAPAIGPYDPLHLNNPNGVAVDSQGRVWVAEADNYPRRVSLWSAKGNLVEAFYGPTEYGGGGTLDPLDPTRFFYKGLEFQLDWKTGTDRLVRVFWHPDPLLHAHYGNYSPDTPLYPEIHFGTPAGPQRGAGTGKSARATNAGRRYFTSCYTHTPTNGDDVAFVWLDGEKQARLVAASGNAHAWPVLREAEFRSHWPQGSKPEEENPHAESLATFAWTDENKDGRPQPAEVRFVNAPGHGVTVMNDLSIVVARFGNRNVRFAAAVDAAGLPHYDLTKPEDLGPAGGRQPSSGGNQSLTEPNGWTITTNAPEPFSPYGLGGKFRGEPRWSYPSPWPGLHASHEAAVPDRPGMVVGHTRLLGGWVGGAAGPMFCINGNMGNMYLITADGLFVSTLFHDIRLRPKWAAPVATRNMDVTDVSLHDENFWPSITQTADGRVFLVDGARTSLVRVDGLDTLQRLPESRITVTIDDLQRARDWLANAEAKRQKQRGSGTLTVPIRRTALQVDGQLNDWPDTTDWAFIDRRGTKANFNSNSRPYEVSAAVALTDTHLFAAWRTTEKNLLTNSGETPNALFKHGGCLDLMLATDPAAAPDRTAPAVGDQRLLITQVKGQTRALLYLAKVPGTKDPVAFSSPWRSIRLDVVEDVSEQVTLATDNTGNYEVSIPLTALHWQPRSGATYRGDVGVLRGSNGQTTQRVYWSNKATAITADVPSEAELTPKLWGVWKIIGEGRD